MKELVNISNRKEVNDWILLYHNILNKETLRLFQIIAKGEYIINGFINKNNRRQLFKEREDQKTYEKWQGHYQNYRHKGL